VSDLAFIGLLDPSAGQGQLFGVTLARGQGLDRAALLDASDELIVEGMSGRRGGESSGRMDQLKYDPPPSADRGEDGERPLQRLDDRQSVACPRLTEYAAITAPLVAWCSDTGLLRQVDGVGAFDEVTAALFRTIGAN
jgi:adenylate kinase